MEQNAYRTCHICDGIQVRVFCVIGNSEKFSITQKAHSLYGVCEKLTAAETELRYYESHS